MKEFATTENQLRQKYLPGHIYNEYNGNFSAFVNLNPAILLEIKEIIGKPKTSLVIRNGTEGPERFDQKQVASCSAHENEPNIIILTIQSQVLDGRIQDEQKVRKASIRYYKKEFLRSLGQIITEGIEDWAISEIEKSPNGKVRSFLTTNKLRKFMQEKREELFI